MRSIKTEGVVGQLALQALRASLRQSFEIVEQPRQVRDAVEQALEGFHLAQMRRGHAVRVDEGETCNLSRALGDQQLDAVLGGDDVGFEDFQPVWALRDLGNVGGIVEPAHDLRDVITHDLAQPRDGVEREQDAQENEEQLGHGRDYTPARAPVGSGGRCPTTLSARGLDSLVKVFRCPTNLMGLYPPPAVILGLVPRILVGCFSGIRR